MFKVLPDGDTEIFDTKILAMLKSMSGPQQRTGITLLKTIENPPEDGLLKSGEILSLVQISRTDKETSPLNLDQIFPTVSDTALIRIIDKKIRDYRAYQANTSTQSHPPQQNSGHPVAHLAAASDKIRADFQQSSPTRKDAIQNGQLDFYKIDSLIEQLDQPLNVTIVSTEKSSTKKSSYMAPTSPKP